MFESVFEFLFKYRPLVFQEGDFTLHATWSIYIFATLVAGAAAKRGCWQGNCALHRAVSPESCLCG